ncbi:MAG: hypothetical protein WD552_01285 [Candidatus Paceibacterota bacterium]
MKKPKRNSFIVMLFTLTAITLNCFALLVINGPQLKSFSDAMIAIGIALVSSGLLLGVEKIKTNLNLAGFLGVVTVIIPVLITGYIENTLLYLPILVIPYFILCFLGYHYTVRVDKVEKKKGFITTIS